jgi:hypothetical protein
VVNNPIDLPSPALAAKVDEWVLSRLRREPAQRARLERDLPNELREHGSAYLTVKASILRLQNAGSVRMVNNRVELVKVAP